MNGVVTIPDANEALRRVVGGREWVHDAAHAKREPIEPRLRVPAHGTPPQNGPPGQSTEYVSDGSGVARHVRASWRSKGGAIDGEVSNSARAAGRAARGGSAHIVCSCVHA